MNPPPLPKPGIKKRWIFSFVFIGIMGVVLAGLAVAVIVVVLFFRSLDNFTLDRPNDQFPKVQIGMTSTQVIGIMGDTYRRQREPDGSTMWLWPILEGTSSVTVSFKEDKVIGKETKSGMSIVGATVSYPAVGAGGYLLPCKVVRVESAHTYLIRYPGAGELLLVNSADDVAIGATIEPGRVRITGSTKVRNPDGDGQVTALITDDTPLPPATSQSAHK